MEKLNTEYQGKKYNIYFYKLNNQLTTIIKDSDTNSIVPASLKIEILSQIFSNYEDYEENEYKVRSYHDGQIKRYFDKEGNENLALFFKYLKEKETKHSKIIKAPKESLKRRISALIATAVFILGLGKICYDQVSYTHELHTIQTTLDEDYNLEYILEQIKNNPSLSSEEKNILLKEGFLEQLLNTDLTLEEKTHILYVINNLSIDDYDLYFKIRERIRRFTNAGNYTAGYTSIHDQNKPNIKILDRENFKNVAPHEFAHTFQHTDYVYLKEAVAEMVAIEFYDAKGNSYVEARKRVSILMEIIGPKPVWGFVYSSSNSLIEELNTRLGEEDAKNFLQLLKEDPRKADNKAIDGYLDKMYIKQYGKTMYEDYLITSILFNYKYDKVQIIPNVEKRRYYFNQDKMESITLGYRKETSKRMLELFKDGTITVTDSYILYHKGITEEEYTKHPNKGGLFLQNKNLDVRYNDYNEIVYYGLAASLDKPNITITDSNTVLVREGQNRYQYTIEEALEKGYLIKTYFLSGKKEITSEDYIRYARSDKTGHFENYNLGEIYNVDFIANITSDTLDITKYDHDRGLIYYLDPNTDKDLIRYPSIDNLFANQFDTSILKK